jgi:hypothetical protein
MCREPQTRRIPPVTFTLTLWPRTNDQGYESKERAWHEARCIRLCTSTTKHNSTALLGYYAQLPSFTGWYSKSWFSSPACRTSAYKLKGMSAQNKPRTATHHKHLLVAYCCWTRALLLSFLGNSLGKQWNSYEIMVKARIIVTI